VSLLYCVSSVFYFHICFILLLHDPVFLTQPHVSSTLSSGVTSPPSTTTGSHMIGIQTIGARASRSHTNFQRSMDETQGNEETSPQEVTLGKRKSRWLHDTFKEANEYVGEP
jgi:hypothetical protein